VKVLVEFIGGPRDGERRMLTAPLSRWIRTRGVVYWLHLRHGALDCYEVDRFFREGNAKPGEVLELE
jgi:hypothetical protein